MLLLDMTFEMTPIPYDDTSALSNLAQSVLESVLRTKNLALTLRSAVLETYLVDLRLAKWCVALLVDPGQGMQLNRWID